MFNIITDIKTNKINSVYTWSYLLACHSGMDQTVNCVHHFKPLFKFKWWNEDPSIEDMCVPYYFSVAPPST